MAIERGAKPLGVAIHAIEILKGTDQALGEGRFASAEPDARIVVFLVRGIWPLRISDLSLQILAILGFVGANAVPKSPLQIGVEVHFDRAIADSLPNFLAG